MIQNKRIRRKTDKYLLSLLVWVYFLQIYDKTVFGYGKYVFDYPGNWITDDQHLRSFQGSRTREERLLSRFVNDLYRHARMAAILRLLDRSSQSSNSDDGQCLLLGSLCRLYGCCQWQCLFTCYTIPSRSLRSCKHPSV